MYNVTQAARHAGVSGTTIRGWTREYSEYLSSTANPPAGQPRQFVEDDLRVFATVATLRAQLVTTEDIRATLDAGQRIEPMPPPEVERADRAGQGEHVEAAAAAAAAATTAIDIYRDRVTALEARADQLADRLIDAEARAAAAERELEVMRQLYEAATSPTPADRRPTFWQWLTGRRA
jgi:DNA-binding transcriptional MerR regulator